MLFAYITAHLVNHTRALVRSRLHASGCISCSTADRSKLRSVLFAL